MHAAPFCPAVLGCALAFVLSGCVHPGPQLASSGGDGQLPDSSAVTPAPPPAPVPPVATPLSKTKKARTVSTDTLSEKATPASPVATPGVNQEKADEDTDAGSDFDNLELVDVSLKGKLAVLRIGSDRTTNNLMSVFAGLKNKTAHRLNLEVQTLYKDKSGNPLNTASWIPLTLKPHEESVYRSASISEEATDFLVRVRRAVPAPTQ